MTFQFLINQPLLLQIKNIYVPSLHAIQNTYLFFEIYIFLDHFDVLML